MGRRAKNKQGDPLPLDMDPDLNGSSKVSKLKTKPRIKGRSSAPNLKAKLGKRKLGLVDEVEHVTKRPKGVQPAGKSKPLAEATPTNRPTAKGKGKHNRERVDSEEDVATDGDGSVRWEGVEGVDMRAEARYVALQRV